MDLLSFIENFRAQFDLAEKNEIFEFDTHFRNFNGYDSLTVLLIFSMIDEVYNVEISKEELNVCATIGELYMLVRTKKNS